MRHWELHFITTETLSFADGWYVKDKGSLVEHRAQFKRAHIKRFHKDRHSHVTARRILLRKLGEGNTPSWRKAAWEAARKDPGFFPTVEQPEQKTRPSATEAEIRNRNSSRITHMWWVCEICGGKETIHRCGVPDMITKTYTKPDELSHFKPALGDELIFKGARYTIARVELSLTNNAELVVRALRCR